MKTTKLVIRIEHAPISIFRLDGKRETDMTHVYESAFLDSAHYYFEVPDGKYLVTQGDKPCIYEVCEGEVTTKPVTMAPIGNVVEEELKEREVEDIIRPYKDSVAGIMHTKTKAKK